MLRPSNEPWLMLPLPLMSVFVDGARSADPPMSDGTAFATSCWIAFERFRVAGLADLRVVVAIDALDDPAVRLVPLPDVLGEREVRFAFDGDLVVVVDGEDVGEAEMPGDARGLAAHAFHHVAVGAQRVHVHALRRLPEARLVQ